MGKFRLHFLYLQVFGLVWQERIIMMIMIMIIVININIMYNITISVTPLLREISDKKNLSRVYKCTSKKCKSQEKEIGKMEAIMRKEEK